MNLFIFANVKQYLADINLVKLFSLFIFIVICFTQTKVCADYLDGYDLVFATDDFLLFYNSKENISYSQYTFPEQTLIAENISTESLINRVKIYQAFGLNDQKIIEHSVISQQDRFKLFYAIIESQWFDQHPTYSIEVWYQNGKDTHVVVSQFRENKNQVQQKNEVLEFVKSFIKERQSNKSESKIQEKKTNRSPASQSQATSCRPSVFNEVSLLEGPMRKLIAAAENKLGVQCHTKQVKKLSNAEIALKVVGGCLKGMADSLVQLGQFIYEIMNFFIKISFNPAYQKNIAGKTVSVLQQAPMALGHVMAELWRNPSLFITNLYHKMIGAIDQKWKDFKSCHSEYQVKMGCMILTDFVSGGVFLKLLMKAKQVKTAAQAIDEVAPGTKVKQAQENSQDQIQSKSTKDSDSDLNGKTDIHSAKNNQAKSDEVQGSATRNPEVKAVIQAHLQHEMIDRSDVQFSNGYSPTDKFRSIREEKHFAVLTELKETESELNRFAMGEFDEQKFDELIHRRDQLYKKSVAIMSEELKAKGIKHTVVHGDKHLAKQIKAAEDYLVERLSLEVATDRLTHMRKEKMPQVLIDDQIAIILKRRKITQELKQGLDPETLRIVDQIKGNKVSDHVRNLLTKPHIVLTGQQPIKILNTAVEKMNAEVVISPQLRLSSDSSLAWVSTSLHKPVFHFPLEAVFDKDITRNSTFYHELQHLRHEQQRSRGIERPLNITFQAQRGNQLFSTMKESGYQNYFSMEELETWVSDIRRSNSPQFEIFEKRLYDLDKKKPVVYSDSSFASAKLVQQMASASVEQISSARKVIQENPKAIKVEMPSNINKYPVVNVPIFQEGQMIGKMKVTLIHLKNNEPREVQAELLRYLELSEAKALKYRAFAEREIRINERLKKSFGGKSIDEILRSLDDDFDE